MKLNTKRKYSMQKTAESIKRETKKQVEQKENKQQESRIKTSNINKLYINELHMPKGDFQTKQKSKTQLYTVYKKCALIKTQIG